MALQLATLLENHINSTLFWLISLTLTTFITLVLVNVTHALGVGLFGMMTIFGIVSANAVVITFGCMQVQLLRDQLKATKKQVLDANKEKNLLREKVELAKAREEGAKCTIDSVTKMFASRSVATPMACMLTSRD